MHEYKVNLEVLDYAIILDKNKKIYSVKTQNNNLEWIRGLSDFYIKQLTRALRIMFLYEPEKFKELFLILKENDSEMFPYAEMAINESIWNEGTQS